MESTPSTQYIKEFLEENESLIRAIQEKQKVAGDVDTAVKYVIVYMYSAVISAAGASARDSYFYFALISISIYYYYYLYFLKQVCWTSP